MHKQLKYFFILLLIFTISCDKTPPVISVTHYNTITIKKHSIKNVRKLQFSSFEKELIKHGFICLNQESPEIHVDLKYASTDNFMHANLYNNFTKAFLYKPAAEALIQAQKILYAIDPSYSIVVYDALRPHSVQKIMWDSCSFTYPQKKNFLAKPDEKSLHNYGLAVDVTILQNGIPLDMGTPFDYAGELAYTYIEKDLLKYGKLNKKQIENRELLRNVMLLTGFIANNYEWWHFQLGIRKEVVDKFPFVKSFTEIVLYK